MSNKKRIEKRSKAISLTNEIRLMLPKFLEIKKEASEKGYKYSHVIYKGRYFRI